MRRQKILNLGSVILMCCVLLSSCEEPYAPKPRGFLRIDLPEKTYTETSTPFGVFETPTYAKYQSRPSDSSHVVQGELSFPKMKATLYLTHRKLNQDLFAHLEECYKYAMKHRSKANGIDQKTYAFPEHNAYGLIYDFTGNTASNVQFYLTDSTDNFLRGSLYFYVAPNYDSLQPMIAYIRKDIEHIMETTRWEAP